MSSTCWVPLRNQIQTLSQGLTNVWGPNPQRTGDPWAPAHVYNFTIETKCTPQLLCASDHNVHCRARILVAFGGNKGPFESGFYQCWMHDYLSCTTSMEKLEWSHLSIGCAVLFFKVFFTSIMTCVFKQCPHSLFLFNCLGCYLLCTEVLLPPLHSVIISSSGPLHIWVPSAAVILSDPSASGASLGIWDYMTHSLH